MAAVIGKHVQYTDSAGKMNAGVIWFVNADGTARINSFHASASNDDGSWNRFATAVPEGTGPNTWNDLP